MKTLSVEEKQELLTSAEDLETLATIIRSTANNVNAVASLTDSVSLADLVPTGNMAKLADRIRERSPISDADFAALDTLARRDIEKHSRVSSILDTVTHVAKTVRNTILPLII